jgi:hypothetical protein
VWTVVAVLFCGNFFLPQWTRALEISFCFFNFGKIMISAARSHRRQRARRLQRLCLNHCFWKNW